jgi:hypothetical protein
MRPLTQLIDKEEPAWALVKGWLEEAKNFVEVLPASDPARSDALVATQVTTRSPMGAVIYESGGILVDNGWLRILGSGGHPRLARSLPEWNRSVGNDLASGAMPFLLIADDVVGGFFALDGGVLGSSGNVFYFAPDSLEWENTGNGYSDFLHWCLNGNLHEFYIDCRWPGWETEIAKLNGDQGISIYPFPFAAGAPVASRHRGIVHMGELYSLYVNDLSAQLRERR